MLDNTHAVFSSKNTVSLKHNEIMIITVMANSNLVKNNGLGYITELLYHNREYDKHSNLDITKSENFKIIPKYPEN